MDRPAKGSSAAANKPSVANVSNTSRTRSPRRTSSELAALSHSILSVPGNSPDHDGDHGHDNHGMHGHEHRSRQGYHNCAGNGSESGHSDKDNDFAPLIRTSGHNSSYSFSLPRSLETGHYSDSLDGSPPLLYGDSFIDHQPIQRQYQHHLQRQHLQQHQLQQHPQQQQQQQQYHHQQQQQQHEQLQGRAEQLSPQSSTHPSSRPNSPRSPSQDLDSNGSVARNKPPRATLSMMGTTTNAPMITATAGTTTGTGYAQNAQQLETASSSSHRLRPGSGSGFSPDTSRSPSFTSDASPPRRAVDPTAAAAAAAAAAKDDVTPGHSAKSSPQLSERSSSSDDMNRTMKEEESLIMPRIITGAQEEQQPHTRPVDHSRGRTSLLAASPTAMDTMGPRMMTPSPVPLHARLSRIQKEARRGGARVLDMENSGASHHYDYEDVTDSSYDFSSRRHSVAEEDVCYPPPAANQAINYTALEEYIRQEQIKMQKVLLGTDSNGGRGGQGRNKTGPGGLLSKLKGGSFSNSSPLSSKATKEINYGSISGPNAVPPERAYSLFGERDRSQIPLDDAYRFTLYSTASVTIHAQTLGEIPPRGQTLSSMLQAGYFWLDVLAPTDEEIRMLSQVFRIHPLTTEDILMEEGREKCEMFLNYYFVCFRTFVLDPNSHNYLQPLSVYTLVFPEGIISYHFRPVPHCRNVRKRIRHLKERMEVTPDWINYAIIDDIVDTFAPLIRQVETEVDMIDELVLILKESEQADMLRRIGNCRKRVMSLLRLLTGKADVIKGLIKRYEGRVGRKGIGEIGLFMGDIQDHIITMLQNLSHYEKILSRSHSNYLAQINIEMTSASNETNDVLTKLTVLGSILLPMNLVTGLWGMNVPVPGQETEDLTWFFWIVTSIFLAAFLFLLIARKIKLL